jgi:hypothetical protein
VEFHGRDEVNRELTEQEETVMTTKNRNWTFVLTAAVLGVTFSCLPARSDAAPSDDTERPRVTDSAPRGLHATPGDFQAPRAQDFQAPRGQDTERPRGQDTERPRGQDTERPRSVTR